MVNEINKYKSKKIITSIPSIVTKAQKKEKFLIEFSVLTKWTSFMQKINIYNNSWNVISGVASLILVTYASKVCG